MYAQRYAPRRMNRGSLSLSVGIVGGLVAAAMLSPTVISHLPNKGALETYWVKPTPPPKPEPLPKPEPRTKAGPVIDKRIVETPAAPEKPYVAAPDQPFRDDPGATDGTGAGAGTVIDAPKPPPVVTGIEIDQRYARDFQPLYPPAEQRAGRDGVVTLKVLVGVDGRVVRAEQLAATSDDFWRVTLKQALGRWRFKPAMRDGIPYEAWRTMTVRFRLDAE